jgi:hypothetical protein
MKSKKELITVRYIPIGEILRGQTFKSFDSLRRKANKIVKPFRDNWMQSVLIKNSIFVNFDLMTKREIVEIFDKHKIRILDEEGVYRIYMNEDIIGEWDNSRRIVITKEGKIAIKIQYVIV